MYKIKYNKQFKLLFLSLLLFSLVFAPTSSALEIVVSGNGSGSESTIAVQVETQTVVQQVNEANINNNIVENLNTGGNEASGNTGGDVNIQTGDISSNTSVSNVVNNSYAETTPCCSSTDIKISNNGSGSINSVILNQQRNINVAVNNNAVISNTVTGNANTGGNKANNNTNGNINIATGDIRILNSAVNDSVNVSSIKVSSGFGGASAYINENSSGSGNDIKADLSDNVSVFLNQNSSIENYIVWDADTGNNEASGNTGGDVNITTGDIDIETFIKNFTNIGGVEISCCDGIYDPGDDDDEDDNDDDDDDGDGGVTPGDGDSKGDNNGSSSTSGGSILPSAAATEAGGPGIMGLSDTSSEGAKNMFFWLSLIFVAFGSKIVIEEILPKTSFNKKR